MYTAEQDQEHERQLRLSARMHSASVQAAFAKEHAECERKTFNSLGVMIYCTSCAADHAELFFSGVLHTEEDQFEPLERTNETQGAPCDVCGSIETTFIDDKLTCLSCDPVKHVYDFEFGEARKHVAGPNWDQGEHCLKKLASTTKKTCTS